MSSSRLERVKELFLAARAPGNRVPYRDHPTYPTASRHTEKKPRRSSRRGFY